MSRNTTFAEADEPVVLLIAGSGEQAGGVIERLLCGQGVVCRRCASVDALLDEVGPRVAGIIITEAMLNGKRADLLRARLSAQSAWSELPLIVVASGGGAVGREAMLVTRCRAICLAQPIDERLLLTAVYSACEARARQRSVHERTERLHQVISQQTAQLTRMQKLVLHMAEREDQDRRRLSEMLHENLQQLMVGAKLHLRLLADQAEESDAPAEGAAMARGLETVSTTTRVWLKRSARADR